MQLGEFIIDDALLLLTVLSMLALLVFGLILFILALTRKG